LEGPYRTQDFRAVFCIPVKDQIPGRRPKRECFPQLLDNPGVVGWEVTLKCKIRRRSCPMIL
jgi:hypothetical protein